MQRNIITIPAGLLRGNGLTWDIDWRGRSAGELTSGVTRTVFEGFPRWTGSGRVTLVGRDLAMWSAIRAAARGRQNIYRVEMSRPLSFVLTGAGASREDVCAGKATAQGNRFTNGKGWAVSPFALAVGDHAKGATEIVVDTSSCGGAVPQVDQIMSHDDWPFSVVAVLPEGGTIYRLIVEMPLRSYITEGDVVLMRGFGLFEAAEAGMGRPERGGTAIGAAEVSFHEVLKR